MSEVSQDGRPSPQEFERVLAAASVAQASFEEEHLSLAKRVQRFLHLYPTTVPFVVLLLGILLGVSVNPERFSPPAICRRADAGDDHRHPRHRADADHSDRRHRSLGRRHHGDFLGRHGPARRRSTACRSSSLSRSACSAASPAARSTACWSRDCNCRRSSSRSAPGASSARSILFYSQSETIREQDIEAKRRSCSSWAFPSRFGGARIILAQLPAGRAGDRHLVRAQPHRLRPPCLRDRRRSGGGAPRRHQHRPHAARASMSSPGSSARSPAGR